LLLYSSKPSLGVFQLAGHLYFINSAPSVAAGYKDNSYQGNDRRSLGYRSYGKEDYGSRKKFQTKVPKEYNPSPEDMLNGPCHIQSTFVDEKRVSKHAMKDCMMFLKLQEAGMSKQAEAKRQGYEGNTNNVPTSQQGNNGASQVLELCPRGNNKDVIIIILVHDNVYIPC
jgi:hypothetical protein